MITATIPVAMAEPAPEPEPMRFGIHANGVDDATHAGVEPDFGVFWVGPWTLKHGWGGPDNQMKDMRSQGVTPAIHFYYWGDDISQSCLEYGCWSDLHGAHKNKAGWQELAEQTVDHLWSQMGGEPVVIFMETEFNKADVQNYEPLDGYLAEKSRFIKEGYPNAEIVMSLGSWNSPAWTTWDRTAEASDFVGIQGMRGSTRDSLSHYQDLYETTLRNADHLNTLFGKPIFIQDLALSSYPEPEYFQYQADELQEFFDGMGALKAAGVEAMAYRTWMDSGSMDLKNYYGYAERHWGFQKSYDGAWKPSAYVYIDGVQAERAQPAGAAPGEAPPFDPSFDVKDNSNEWWVQLSVSGSPRSVQASYDGGSWQSLQKQSWGDWTKSFHVPAGGEMVFRATDSYGQTVTADPILWLSTEQAPEPEAPPFDATFTVKDGSNEWWVQADVQASNDLKTVEAQYDGGTWNTLELKSWGDWAASFRAPAGGEMVFRATDAHGQVVTSDPVPWLTAAEPEPEPEPNQAPTAAMTVTQDGQTVQVDASGSSDPNGDDLSYAWDFGDGQTAAGVTAEHSYAPGDHTVTLTVLDGEASDTATRMVTVEAPNQAPSAAFTATVADGAVHLDASESSDPDGDKLSYTWDLGDGKTATGATASHSYAPGDHTVTLTVSDGEASDTATRTVTVEAPAFSADFTVHPNSNEWWVQVAVDASSTPAKVEASHDGGPWHTLELKSWGHHAASFWAPAGGEMVFRATDSHGQSVTSDPVPWLGASEVPGFEASFTPVTQSNKWWVEVKVSANDDVASVTATIDGKRTVDLQKTDWGSWATKVNVGKDARVVFTATAADGRTAQSGTYRWG